MKILPVLLLLSCVTISCGYDSVKDIKSTVEALFKTVVSSQQTKDSQFVPPVFWKKDKGMWESDVKFYFHGHEDLYLFREAFSVYDNNMFATTWIASCLLEAHRYGNAPKPSEETILNAVLSLREYHNKNLDYTNSLMTFWPQVFNASTNYWNAYPVNIHHLFDMVGDANFTTLEKILEDLGLGDIANVMEILENTESAYLTAFLIPPDFDDTFVNVGLGALLSELKQDFPTSNAQWASQNQNVTSVFDALKKYAYRPMTSDPNVNIIDCRTYFFLRHFLEEAQNKNESVALVPTWIQNLEELKERYWKGVAMPLNTNNVDVTVAANSIFGITSAILSDVTEASVLDDPEIQQIYLNTTTYISYMIKGNFSSRPDLSLVYYPSAVEFYWFVARTYSILEQKSRLGPLPHTAMARVRGILDEALHLYMTPALLNNTKTDKEGNVYFDDFLGDGDTDRHGDTITTPGKEGNVYFDDFIGDGDTDRHGDTIVRGEDRLFTTGMAINALITTWTVFDENTKQLVWEKDVWPEITDTVSKAAAFLNKHILGRSYKPWNAFFSGSVKGNSTWPQYPLTNFNVTTPHGLIQMFGVEGVLPEAEYQKLLAYYRERGWAPQDFHGFNNVPDFWPFWSSEPYTYVTSMLALAKFSNTVPF